MRTIYLDYTTSTPVAASVRESMLPFLSEFYGHPSSNHWSGRATNEAIEDARSNLAGLLGCHPSEIVFTSGGTESVNLALLGLAPVLERGTHDGHPHLIITRLEHACVRQCAQYLASRGWDISIVDCLPNGTIDVALFESAIREDTRLASITHASPDLGTVQPVPELAQICHENNILLHCDACQSVGKIETNVEELDIDLLSLSGHKFYAPKGVGALYVRSGVPIQSIMHGEGMEAGLRPGTPNVPHIVGLGQAAKMAQSAIRKTEVEIARKRDQLQFLLEEALGFPLSIHGAEAPRLPGVLCFQLPNVTALAIKQHLPEIAFGPSVVASNGFLENGNDHSERPTEILPISREQMRSTIQLSIGWNTTEDEIRMSAQMIAAAYEALST